MKIQIIPDVHGSTKWKDVINREVDEFVFMGDYFDSWNNKWPEQGENFKEIVDFVRKDPAHRHLLIGNHDWAYLSTTPKGALVSGHQVFCSEHISQLLLDAKDILKIAVELDGWVFSHAGFSDEGYETLSTASGCAQSIEEINGYFSKLLINRNAVYDKALDWHGYFDAAGDESCQGPLWIRPISLLKNLQFAQQVVGHTEMTTISDVMLSGTGENSRVLFVDSRQHTPHEVFDTEKPQKAISVLEFQKQRKAERMIVLDFNSSIVGDVNERLKQFKKKFGNTAGEILFNEYINK